MGLPLLILVTLMYSAISLSEFIKGNGGNGVIFLGYTIANFGLMAALR